MEDQDLTQFAPFPKIARLNRDCVITEKIDGTNAQIIITPDGQVLAASRTRLITPENDNYGFARWVYENAEALKRLGYGRHFGEWWGAGIQRKYGLINGKKFSLFNVHTWAGVLPEGLPENVSVVPVLYRGPFSTMAVDNTLQTLKEHGSSAAPGFNNPEGIVIFHTASSTLYKVTLEGDEQPKGLTERQKSVKVEERKPHDETFTNSIKPFSSVVPYGSDDSRASIYDAPE